MDAAVPLASLPAPMSGRNWMLRRLIVDSIRNDPDWQAGNYTQQPKSLQFASVFPETAGHGTTAQAKFWSRELAECLRTAPRLD